MHSWLCLNLLHGFGGLGSILSPMLVSVAISYKNNWRMGYYLVFCLLAAVWFIFMLSISKWKKTTFLQNGKEEKTVNILFKEQMRNRTIVLICLIIAGTSILEFAVGVWGSTLFTDSHFIYPEVAASLITSFYAGMTVGRFLISIILIKTDYKKILIVAISLLSVISVMLFFKLNIFILFILMFMFGMTNGPIYPLIVSVTPEIVGIGASQSVIGTEITFAYLGCLFTHICLGVLVKLFSISVLPFFVLGGYVLLTASFFLFLKAEKKNIDMP